MKLTLINPSNKRDGFSSYPGSLFPPLGLGILAGLTPDTWDVELIDENFDSVEAATGDLIAITAFTSTVTRAYEIAAKAQGPVILGGPHVSVRPNETKHSVVIGEAESIWADVLRDVKNNKLQRVYHGNKGVIGTPDYSIFDPRYQRMSVQTARGCPYACDYCSVTRLNGARYRSRDTNDVLADLLHMGDHFFIVDDNFIGTRRDTVLDLLRRMTKPDLVHWAQGPGHWFCQTSIDVATDDEMLAALYRAGCRMLFIGIEAEDGAVSKRTIPCVTAMKNIHKHGLAVLGSFMLGLTDDTADSMHDRVEFIHTCGVDAYQVSLMTPLPGTPMYDKCRDRLLTHDWRRYDFTDIVYLPPAFDDLLIYQQVVAECMANLYSSRRIKDHAKETLKVTNSTLSTIFAYRANSNYMQLFHERVRHYEDGKTN